MWHSEIALSCSNPTGAFGQALGLPVTFDWHR